MQYIYPPPPRPAFAFVWHRGYDTINKILAGMAVYTVGRY